ncbi:CAMP-dependent protein kinase catalytic subunit [Theileria orientalis]|uniref:cAMP-dependent protein kinase catalytic subunit n=1 Tax=Theileria orientalis TaxID=68886 RepID=A0A976M9U4_THEOR|nr:CAMP-dependent protein kinase catalytic subunit [Theileria orientalis]
MTGEDKPGCVNGLLKSFKNLFKKKNRITLAVQSSSPRATFSLNSFKFLKVLGEGGFGKVYLASPVNNEHLTGQCAIKRLKKDPLINQRQVDHVLSEKRLLSSVNHPFVVNMLGSFKDDYYLYIVMELVKGGDFFTYLRRSDRLKSESAMFYAAQVTTMFEYLHESDIVYRDLKPENLLLCDDGYLKLTDFGFAKVVEFRTYTVCGTPEYIAPEILLNKGHGKAVDWWTLGILIYEMLVGYPPYYDEDQVRIYKKVLEAQLRFPSFYDENAKFLTTNLLAKDPTKRFGNLHRGIDDIKNCAWFEPMDFKKLLNKELDAPHVPKPTKEPSGLEYRESIRKPKPVVGSDDPFVDW